MLKHSLFFRDVNPFYTNNIQPVHAVLHKPALPSCLKAGHPYFLVLNFKLIFIY